MRAPDVVYVDRDGLYDTTAKSWDARNLVPLVPEPAPGDGPLRHKPGCYMTPWPDLADLCPCTVEIRARRARAVAH